MRHVLAHRPVAAVALAAIAVFTLSGCLEAPELEDRWTRLDVVSLTTEANAPTKWGEPVTLHARGRITYRAVLTGAVAMELRYSDAIGFADVQLEDDVDRLAMTEDIEQILAGSTVLASGAQSVTGFHKLIQEIDFDLQANLPAGPEGGLFVIFYFGEEEEVEGPGGEMETVVHPIEFAAHEILPGGMELVPEDTP
ncbi:MAG: hypothetical protein KC729_08030 [Candidatus Eisenbacteria bacterium]|uniref:Uncharacterized protein n=1 Tax=Eiseniibacteriota bacterium TaxID=2212470 RepID=A0A956RNK0_UNCEI|nr:hypothetical protein [Candidatus Eisenbacteria bacterium]